MNLKYQMIIRWSEEDKCFLVGSSDFPGQNWRIHGDTYQEEVNNGIDTLESLVIAYQTTGYTLPQLTFNQAAYIKDTRLIAIRVGSGE
jgi:predicted RNase H-like HicB family nuclease